MTTTRKILTEKFFDFNRYDSMDKVPNKLWRDWDNEIDIQYKKGNIKVLNDLWSYCIENFIKPCLKKRDIAFSLRTHYLDMRKSSIHFVIGEKPMCIECTINEDKRTSLSFNFKGVLDE